MSRQKLIFAAVVGVVFLFAGYNLYSYFGNQAALQAERERVALEERAAQERQREIIQAERERREAEAREAEERERREAAELEARRQEERRQREAARAAADLAAQEEARRDDEARLEELVARAREVQSIEDFNEEVIETVRAMSPRYIRDNPEEFQEVYRRQAGEFSSGFAGERFMYQDGSTSLMIFAAISRNTDALQALLDVGVDINATNEQGFTALMFAAAYNRPEIVAFLLSKGADVGAQAYDRDLNALHIAALRNPHPDVVEALVRAGMPLEARITTGETAILLAASENSNLEVAERLGNLGADTSVYNDRGQPVRAIAERRTGGAFPLLTPITPEVHARILEALR